MDGQRVAAEVPDGLHEGQLVNLAVSSVSAERLVLRINEGSGVPTRMPTPPLDASAVLRALDLPDTAATRAVVTALVERGQPLTRDTIVALRAVVARETGQEIQNARGAVDALLKGIPVTLRSAALARSTAVGVTAAPMGTLLRELMMAIETAPAGALRTPADGSLVVAPTVPEATSGALAVATDDPSAVAVASAGALPAGVTVAAGATTDARNVLARLLENLVAQNPTAAELQRVITVLQGAPEARIAQAILDTMAQAATSAVAVDVGAAESASSVAAGTGTNVPAITLPGGAVTTGGVPIVANLATGTVTVPGAPGVVALATDALVPNVPNVNDRSVATGMAARALGGATDPNTPSTAGAPAASVTAGAVSVALAASLANGGHSAWVTAGPDARSFLGALLALFGGTSRSEVGMAPTSATRRLQAGDPPAPGTPPNQVPDRSATSAAILARVIHDRLEYQQLGNAAALARGGWENGGSWGTSTTGTLVPATTTTGTRPEASTQAFLANVSVPPPADALNFSVPLAFAGQMATLELTVWRDGGRRHDSQEESTPGLHARVRLDLAQLGRVGADIRIAGQNLRCRLTADRAETNVLLQENGEALLGRLRAAGFTVEGLDHRPFTGATASAGPTESPSVVRRVDMGL
jgi:hypothetical protein